MAIQTVGIVGAGDELHVGGKMLFKTELLALDTQALAT